MERWDYTGAKDRDVAPGQRPMCTRRETGLVGALVSLPWWILVRGYLRLAHRLHVCGREHLPLDPRFIIVANHASHLDALSLAAALPLRWNGHVFPVAAGDTFFEKPSAAWFAALCLNALPLWRRRASGHALTDLRDRVEAGHSVLILFPEGTRSRDGRMAGFKPGIGRLVAGTTIPVVPAYLEGAHRAFPPRARCPRPTPIRITFGPPRFFADQRDTRDGWRAVSAELETAVRALS